MKIIIFSGVDGSGKSTIKKRLEEKLKYKYICLDRFSDSIIYDRIYNRGDREKEFLKLEDKLNKNFDIYLVYCYADITTILKRINMKKEKKDILNNIYIAMMLYNDYLKKTKFRYIKINTGKYDVDKCVEKIIKFVEK